MLIIALLASTLASAGVPEARDAIDHRGERYEVAHRATVHTRAKTVGMAAGTRMSTQRCRWTATVQVERSVARAGTAAAATNLLPGLETVTGDRAGPCPRAMQSVQAEPRVRKAAAQMVARASADRASVLAAIDAAWAIAAR